MRASLREAGRITSVDPGGWIQLVNCGHPPALRLSTDGELSPLAPATFTAPLGLHPDPHLSTFSAGPS
jgi:hypothetical protein